MRFRVGRDAFSEAVQWTARALPNRPAVPILAGLRLTATDGQLALSSFDYEVSASAQVEAEVETSGEVLVSGKLLADISRALPNRDVRAELTDSHLVINCGNSEFTLANMTLADYPAVPAMPELAGTVDSAVFAEAIGQVVIAASKEEAVPLLSGVRVEIEGSVMTLMSTDRYRLSLRQIEWNPGSPDYSASLLVKSKVLADVAKSMSAAGEVEIYLSDTSAIDRSSLIGFSAGPRQATSILMDGDYPPVRKLFPEQTPLEYACNRQELLEAVRRVSLVAERKTSLRMTFADGALTLEAGQGDSAQAQESVELITECEDLRTAFNPQYLQEGLAVSTADYVRFGFTHPSKAAVMVGQDGRDGDAIADFKYLLMPIRFGV